MVHLDTYLTLRALVGVSIQFDMITFVGVWDVLDNFEAVQICLNANGASNAANELTQSAIRRGTMDNTTSLVVDLSTFVRR